MDGTTLPSKATCHTGNSVLWTSPGGGRLTIGGASRKVAHLGFMVDLTEGKSLAPYQPFNGNPSGMALAKNLLKAGVAPGPYLNMPIRDQGIPLWDSKVTKALALDVREALGSGMDVTIACLGGHGRSGMIAAVILQLLDPVKDEHPVTRLRRLHCANAIENEAQVRFVCDCTGFPFDKELVIMRVYKPVPGTAVTVYENGDDPWDKYSTEKYRGKIGAKPFPLTKKSRSTDHYDDRFDFMERCGQCGETFDTRSGKVLDTHTGEVIDQGRYPAYELDLDYPLCGSCDAWTRADAARRGQHPAE